MVVRIAFLILLFAGLTGTAVGGELNSCLGCHGRAVLTHTFVDDSSIALTDCVACHRGNAATRRKDLAHFRLIEGRYCWYRFADSAVVKQATMKVNLFACRRCHRQAKQGNALAVDLDHLYGRRSISELDDALTQPAYYMPDFQFSREDRDLVILALLAGGVDQDVAEQQDVSIVHFEEADAEPRPFEKHCGSCHRVLTAHAGGLGQATVAPNLSGLLTPFYPQNFKEQQAWDADGLSRWIKNPRQIRPLSPMPPLNLDDQQIRELIDNSWPVSQGEPH
ncbi:MAG: hypothetical protein C0620_07295 [Desulfuromonas sp.]|nr:MAG: hypothetical protein C0620_07295 [Desulfuromonas sp.]